MTRVTTAFAAALALILPIGRPLLVGLAPAIGIGAGLLSMQTAQAQTIMSLYESGSEKFQKGDYEGAISDYNKAIEINPRDADVYYKRGNAKSELKDYQGAIADYTKAIQINPALRQAYINRGIDLEIVGDPQGACSDWRKAADLGHAYAIEWVRNEC